MCICLPHSRCWEGRWTSSHNAARAAGASLRIDVVKTALARIVDELGIQGFEGAQLQIGVHTFSNNFTTVLQPTTNLSSVKSALNSIDLSGDVGEGGTDFYSVLNSTRSKVGKSKSGLSASNRKKFIMFVTDGISSNVGYTSDPSNIFAAHPGYRYYSPFYNGNAAFSMQGFDPAACRQIKDRDVTLFTLNVRYIIPTVGTDNDPRFSEIGQNLKPDIQQHMQECATSSEHAMWADTPAEIDKALEQFVDTLTTDVLRIGS
ncbi:MAG: VWA domain-containing protein [Nitratireductor sp.]